MEKKIKWIALQPLIGGMAVGAEQAFGTPPAMILNYDGVANTSAYVHYMNNVRKLNIPYYEFEGDIYSNSTTFKNNAHPNFSDVDVVSAVPICSGLSTANAINDKSKETARGADAKQNNNMLNCTEFTLGTIKPKCYIFENAPALFTATGAPVREKLNALASKYGYCVAYIKTNTMLHQNVQHRPRTFAIFTKGTNPVFHKVYEPFKGTILDFLKDIPASAKYQDVMMFKNMDKNDYIKYIKSKGADYRAEMEKINSPCVIDFILKTNDDENACKIMGEKGAAFVRHARNKVNNNRNFFDNTPLWYGPNKVSVIFGRTFNRMIHPTREEGYNMREILTFMGMPYDFEWPDAEKKMNWIGQNVPAHTAYDWHLQIKEYLEGKLPTDSSSVKQLNNTEIEKAFKFGAVS